MIEPGAVDTELRTHITQEQARRRSEEQASGIRQLQPQDIAHVVVDVVTRPPHMSINEVLVRPTRAGEPPPARTITHESVIAAPTVRAGRRVRHPPRSGRRRAAWVRPGPVEPDRRLGRRGLGVLRRSML